MSMMAAVRQGSQVAHRIWMEHAAEPYSCDMQHTSAKYLNHLIRNDRIIETEVQMVQHPGQGNAASTQELVVIAITTVQPESKAATVLVLCQEAVHLHHKLDSGVILRPALTAPTIDPVACAE